MGYMHIENLYKNTRILQFKSVYAMEKVHGTSAHVAWKDGEVRLFSGGEPLLRFEKLFDKEALKAAFEKLGHPEVVVYGEAYGGSQQGMSGTYGPDLKFIAFDVLISHTESESKRSCLVHQNVTPIAPTTQGVSVKSATTPISDEKIQKLEKKLASIDAITEQRKLEKERSSSLSDGVISEKNLESPLRNTGDACENREVSAPFVENQSLEGRGVDQSPRLPLIMTTEQAQSEDFSAPDVTPPSTKQRGLADGSSQPRCTCRKIDSWLNVPNMDEVARGLGFEVVPWSEISTDLDTVNRLRDRPSEVAVRRGITEPRPREGVVLRPIEESFTGSGARIMAKHKIDKFGERKSQPQVHDVDGAKLAVLTEANAIADEWVTEERLNHVLSHLTVDGVAPGIEKTRDVISAMIEDVCREAKDEIVESKEVKRAIGQRAAQLFKKKLQSVTEVA